MDGEQLTLVNFIAKGASPDEWRMVLVEVGPWDLPIEAHLHRLQERLYGCVDAALDGQLADQFPETRGQSILIQLDCYNLPKVEIGELFERFAFGIFEIPDYRDALKGSSFVKGISFEITFDSIH